MDNTNNSCCCGETEHFSGCLICGAPVTYSVESSVKTCSICHKEQLTNAVCENGHFVCDACHSYGTYIPVSTALRSSIEKDPLLLLEEIMDLPSVHMHGPEHHAIVPSVLLTALRNNGERMNYDTALSEICKRAKQVPGGTCGYWGVQMDKAIIAEDVTIGNNVVLGCGEEAPNVLKPAVYAFGIATVGERSVIPDNVRIGKNTAISGITVPEDYPDGELAVIITA